MSIAHTGLEMDGGETELSSEFHDFSKVDERLFPFRILNFAGGQCIGELRIHAYRVNPQLPESLFMAGAGISYNRNSEARMEVR